MWSGWKFLLSGSGGKILPLLTRHFIQKYNYRFETLVTAVSTEVENLFADYSWPGNVRELEHAIEGAMNQVEGDRIELEHLPRHLTDSGRREGKFELFRDMDLNLPLPLLLSRVEEESIRRALKTTGNNVRRAAAHLGIPRQTLQYKLRRLGLNPNR